MSKRKCLQCDGGRVHVGREGQTNIYEACLVCTGTGYVLSAEQAPTMWERLNAMQAPVFCDKCHVKYMDDEMHTCTDKVVPGHAAGKTLRDELAIGILPTLVESEIRFMKEAWENTEQTAESMDALALKSWAVAAKDAYAIADEMLKARGES